MDVINGRDNVVLAGPADDHFAIFKLDPFSHDARSGYVAEVLCANKMKSSHGLGHRLSLDKPAQLRHCPRQMKHSQSLQIIGSSLVEGLVAPPFMLFMASTRTLRYKTMTVVRIRPNKAKSAHKRQ